VAYIAKIINSCWLTFAVVWLLAAFTSKPSVYRESLWQRLRYSLILAAGCVLLFKGFRFGYPLALRLIPWSATTAWTGAALCVAGLMFCFWARATLGRNWSGTITIKEAHELIIRGPYRLVRHPIYTGLLTMFVGTAMVTGNLAGVIGVLLAFVSLWVKLKSEESIMLRQFPDEYAAYRRRVKRIIPFIL